MHFNMKNTLKNNRNHTSKHARFHHIGKLYKYIWKLIYMYIFFALNYIRKLRPSKMFTQKWGFEAYHKEKNI